MSFIPPAVIVALIKGAVEVFTKEGFKDNIKQPSTVAASVPVLNAVALQAAIPESEEAAYLALANAIVGLLMFFLRKAKDQ